MTVTDDGPSQPRSRTTASAGEPRGEGGHVATRAAWRGPARGTSVGWQVRLRDRCGGHRVNIRALSGWAREP